MKQIGWEAKGKIGDATVSLDLLIHLPIALSVTPTDLARMTEA